MRLTEIESCYVAALIDGLRLIDEKEQERGAKLVDPDWNALVHYVAEKGKRIAVASDLRPNPKALRTRFLVLEAKRRWYQRHKPRIRAQQKAHYRAVAEVIKQRVRDYVARNHAKVLDRKRLYRVAHRKVLAQKELARYHNYYRFKEKYLEARAEYRERIRLKTRRWSRNRSLAADDSYLRELLAKNSTKSSRDFTEEEVDQKRRSLLDLRARRLTDDECEEIRQSTLSLNEAAAYYGVNRSTIHNIRTGKTRAVRHELKEAA